MVRLVGSGLIQRDGKFLLVNAAVGVPKGLWNNPGGRQEEGESVEKTALREIEEETGLHNVILGDLLCIVCYKDVEKYIYDVVSYEGTPVAQMGEIDEVAWFSYSDIEQLSNVTSGVLAGIRCKQQGLKEQRIVTEQIP